MDNLPDAMEIYRVLPYLPPGHLGRVLSSGPPPFHLDDFSSDPFQVGKRTVFASDRIVLLHLRHAIPGRSCILAEFFLNRWVWVDLFTESILLFPLEA